MLCDYQSNPVCSRGNAEVMEKREGEKLTCRERGRIREKMIENNSSSDLK
jgi:hypothetical protein